MNILQSDKFMFIGFISINPQTYFVCFVLANVSRYEFYNLILLHCLGLMILLRTTQVEPYMVGVKKKD